MSTFKQIADLMADRQEIRITIQKVGEDLVTITNLDFKKKGDPIHISGTPDELDEHYIIEISKPLQHKTAFSSNADKVAEKAEKDGKAKPAATSSSSNKSKKKAAPKKKAPVKKAAPVKKSPVKAAPKKPEIKKGLSALLDKSKKDIAANKPAANQLDIEKEAQKIEEQYKAAMTAGNSAFKSKSYEVAAMSFKEALKLKPEDGRAKLDLQSATEWQDFTTFMEVGKEALTAQKFQDAVDAYAKAFNIFPKNDEVNTQLGISRKKLAAFQLLNEDLV